MDQFYLGEDYFPSSISIIGGGFCGSLVAINLLRSASHPLRIQLIERKFEIGSGVAYGTQLDCHLLNVPAGKMSAFADEPTHFLRWLAQEGYSAVTAASFVPRRLYGNYLRALLQEAEEQAPAFVSLERIYDEAIALRQTTDGIQIDLSSGRCLSVQKVVLALGNFPSALPQPVSSLDSLGHFVRDAWSLGALADLQPEDTVLLLGTGLSMVDMTLALYHQGFRGQIHALSRHGLLPLAHKPTAAYPAFIDAAAPPTTCRELLHKLRQEVQVAERAGQDWRAVIDALRPITQQLWQSLPVIEQRRFLRHLNTYWSIHRHRISPKTAEVLETIKQSGQLTCSAGRIKNCLTVGNRLAITIQERSTQSERQLIVDRIVNCTGSNCNFLQIQHPLLQSLRDSHLIRPSGLNLGLDTTADGALIDADGVASTRLYTLGSPRKGSLWESTAVPELRVQAAQLAQELLQVPADHPATTPRDHWSAQQAVPLQRGRGGTSQEEIKRSTLLFRQLFDPESSTYTYLIADSESHEAVLVDPVFARVERDLQIVRELGLSLRFSLETHLHADHITGTDRLRQLTGCLGIVPEHAAAFGADGWIADGNRLMLGSVEIRAIATPGHTDCHMAYLVNGTHLLTGDALFIRGCGRTDFQNGDAGKLYDSVTQRLFTLADTTLVYPGHDCQGHSVSTIGEEKAWNPRFSGLNRSQFIELMNNLNLPAPKNMRHALPANQRCGQINVA
jgi:uncharacterized NAD(P)/FAD-binding protein YdhS/glyoxylase-like metal-dependent hydrolase (beta-lactamase superfamily II)